MAGTIITLNTFHPTRSEVEPPALGLAATLLEVADAAAAEDGAADAVSVDVVAIIGVVVELSPWSSLSLFGSSTPPKDVSRRARGKASRHPYMLQRYPSRFWEGVNKCWRQSLEAMALIQV